MKTVKLFLHVFGFVCGGKFNTSQSVHVFGSVEIHANKF
jgi:hypothetical protein